LIKCAEGCWNDRTLLHRGLNPQRMQAREAKIGPEKKLKSIRLMQYRRDRIRQTEGREAGPVESGIEGDEKKPE